MTPVEAAESAAAPAQRSRMINFSNAIGSPEAASTPVPVPAALDVPADGSGANAARVPAGRKDVAPVIDGYKVPQGATVVDDAKLKQEIMEQLRRR